MEFSVEEMGKVRLEFPILEQCVFFNHAGTSPLPRPTVRAIQQWADDAARFGHQRHAQWRSTVEATRHQCAALLDCDAEEVAFVKNTTHGLLIVASSIDWQPGDNIVSAQYEFPANVYPWKSLASRGVELRFAKEHDYRFSVESIAEQIDKRTRLVTLSFVEFSTGFRHNLRAIGELCAERNILFCVDGIQGFGVIPLSVRECRVDFLAADGHKWLLCPEGTGMFYCRKERLAALKALSYLGWHSVIQPDDYLNYDQAPASSARRFEEGSPNTMGIHALNASLEFLMRIGIERIYRQIMAITGYLMNRLEEKGYEVISSRVPEERSGIVVCRTRNAGAAEIHKHLLSQHIITAARRDMLRISPHFYNSREDIDRLIAALPD
jgi:cysteine desulfurase/selenocysteine lyase